MVTIQQKCAKNTQCIIDILFYTFDNTFHTNNAKVPGMYRIDGIRSQIMRKSTLLNCSIVAILSTYAASPALAVESIDGSRFKESCRAYEKYKDEPGEVIKKVECAAFVQGYLAALERFDVIGQQSEPSFEKRALSTRAKGLLHRDKRLMLKRYCVPEEETVDTIVTRINQEENSSQPQLFAENIMERVLKKYYRCAK